MLIACGSPKKDSNRSLDEMKVVVGIADSLSVKLIAPDAVVSRILETAWRAQFPREATLEETAGIWDSLTLRKSEVGNFYVVGKRTTTNNIVYQTAVQLQWDTASNHLYHTPF